MNSLFKQRRGWRSIALTVTVAIFAILSIATPLLSHEAQAINHRGTYYFSGNGGSLGNSECNIKSDGYHGGADPASFIASVRDAEGRGYNYNCSGLDQIGARYVVYTFLGRGVQYNESKKWERISAADWTEFERRVYSTTMSDQVRRYSDNGCLSSAVSYYLEDANQFHVGDCSDTYNSVVFTVGGSIVYIIDRNCMNPIGDYVGPPSYNYSLTPSVDLVTPSATEGSGNVQVTTSVNNGGSTGSPSVDWKATVFKLPKNVAIPAGGDSTTAPEQFYGNGAVSTGATAVSTPGPGSGAAIFKVGANNVPIVDQTIGDFEVGTKICYTLSVKPISQSNGSWRHSAPRCLTISKKPKVQILGGDLILGSTTAKVQTSTSSKKVDVQRTFGSWSEYGIVAPGSVLGMASAAGYSGGSTQIGLCAVSLLTFANSGATGTCSNASVGGYTKTRNQPDISSRFIVNKPSLGTNPTINLGSLANGVYTGNGTINISASTIAKGRWVVINAPNETVTIKGDINYFGGALQSLSDIPQVVIIANRINIEGGVGNVDAWLVARGTTGSIYTCSDYAAFTDLNADRCNKPLTVNGPVVTQHLYLYRTGGSGTGDASDDPAEKFNLRPDAYLWATGYLSGAGRLQTVSTKELPPRF